jgi:hypothetical protein
LSRIPSTRCRCVSTRYYSDRSTYTHLGKIEGNTCYAVVKEHVRVYAPTPKKWEPTSRHNSLGNPGACT